MCKSKNRSFAFEWRKINPLKILWVIFMGLTLTAGLGALEAVQSSTAHAGKAAGKKAIIQKVMKLQMPFFANQGQIHDERVRFYAQTFGGTVYVTQEGDMLYSFSLVEPKAKEGDPLSKPESVKHWTLKETLIGASIVGPQGIDRAKTKVNYFIGNDKSKWKTNIPTYNLVSLGEVYKGIDLRLRAYGKKVEKVFTVNPGADLKAIRLTMQGANSLRVNETGELEVETALGVVNFSKPLAYQEKNGKRNNVQVAYHLAKDTYGFTVGNYDPSLPLIIDPEVRYSTHLGGGSNDFGNAIAVDEDGNAYVAGSTDSATFNGTIPPDPGGTDVLVAKLNADGSSLYFLTLIGGGLEDTGHGIALDGSGNVFVTGQTFSKDLPTPGGFDNKIGGKADAFVAKLNANSGSLISSTYLGGGGKDKGNAVTVDAASGNVFAVGEALSSNFPVTPHVIFADSQGRRDGFVTKMDDDLSSLIYSTYLGGTGNDICFGIAVDSFGNAHVTGQTSSKNFLTIGAPYDALNGRGPDAFVAKLNDDASSLLFSTYLGGSGEDVGYDIALDSSGNAYVTGETDSADFPLEAAFDGELNDGTTDTFDAFVTKLNAGGTDLLFSTYLGGSGNDSGLGITVDNAGNAYVAGQTDSADFPLEGAFDGELNDGITDTFDAFVTKLNAGGTDLLFSTYLGGSGDDVSQGIALGFGAVYVTGYTNSNNSPFPTTVGAFQVSNAGGFDAFVTKICEDTDEDGVCDDVDNCPDIPNPPSDWTDIYGDVHYNSQADHDLDGVGDACDDDDDNDGILDGVDNCPFNFNPGQEDQDDDEEGNDCDLDADGDGYISFEYGGDDCYPLDGTQWEGLCAGAPAPKPKGSSGSVDSDGDGENDTVDNCPNVPNAGQEDVDNDDIGDACDTCPVDPNNDADGDGICGDVDNCPNAANADQADSDSDGLGDACDNCPDDDNAAQTDNDGDGVGNACDNCLDVANADQADSDNDGVGNECDDSVEAYFISFINFSSSTGEPYSEWLSGDGKTATVTAQVNGPEGVSFTHGPFTFTFTSTNYPGKYTNDPDISIADDFTHSVSGDTITLTCHDFGGSITIHAEATVTDVGGIHPATGDFTLPLNTDSDSLPDAWEIAKFGNLSHDGSDTDGDGLTNFQEFRGFQWGPPPVLVSHGLADSAFLYQTPAYVPQGDAVHFRTDPLRQDLFVKFKDYDFLTHQPCGGDCPFALGAAFNGAGVDVHVVSLDVLPSFMVGGVIPWETNIDVAQITNNLTSPYGGTNGHINKRGIRDWDWDTKGWSGIGDATTYGGGTTTYWTPLDYYFNEAPYIDNRYGAIGGDTNSLDQVTIAAVEDHNDNGTNDRIHGTWEAEAAGDPSVLEGDLLVLPISYGNDWTAVDVDGDGNVELPLVSNASSATNYLDEYTMAQVLKHTITHELGHAVGMSHNSNNFCLMYKYSPNWSRDDTFSSFAQGEMRIHNN